MKTANSNSINVLDIDVKVFQKNNNHFICLTDMLSGKDGIFSISDWLSHENTIEFLGVWETLNNPDFDVAEFAKIKSKAGLDNFKLSVKEWVNKTKAIGIKTKSGRNGGTYAHSDIALEFGFWISAEFKVYFINEFQKLNMSKNTGVKKDWNLKRTLSKINYSIQTDAIKETLVPKKLSTKQESFIYRTEANLLNMALFGCTSDEWREETGAVKGKIRDEATLEQLVVLSNLESVNAVLIRQGMEQAERLRRLNAIAINQMQSLLKNADVKNLA